MPSNRRAQTILAGFAAAGIFSSFVAKSAGTDAIIRGSECGFWIPSNADGGLEFQQKILNDTIQSSVYSRDCYGSGAKPLTCVKYVTQDLPYNSSDKEPCPFASNICSDRAPAFMLDSGPLDSHVHFGINAAPKNRLTYRKRTTCSVLNFTRMDTKRRRVKPLDRTTYPSPSSGSTLGLSSTSVSTYII